MDHDHHITVFELIQLLAVFAVPFLLVGAMIQHRVWVGRRTRIGPVAVAVIGASAAIVLTALFHLAGAQSLSAAWGFPAWVIAPPISATILVTAIVWLLASRLPNEEL